jgi:hypothetical protein
MNEGPPGRKRPSHAGQQCEGQRTDTEGINDKYGESVTWQTPVTFDPWLEKQLKYAEAEHIRLHGCWRSRFYLDKAWENFEFLLWDGKRKFQWKCWFLIQLVSRWLIPLEGKDRRS